MWNSHVHREFPGKFESSNISRDNVSREIGRTTTTTTTNHDDNSNNNDSNDDSREIGRTRRGL